MDTPMSQQDRGAEKELNASWISFDELLSKSDVLSVYCILSNETRERFNWDAFKQMKPRAIFINTARGAIHHEPDLIEALSSKQIWEYNL